MRLCSKKSTLLIQREEGRGYTLPTVLLNIQHFELIKFCDDVHILYFNYQLRKNFVHLIFPHVLCVL